MKKLSAFTLAEILISLTILGIVAAITLSNTITNIKKQRMITGLKRAYSLVSNLVNNSEVENGVYTNWIGYYNTHSTTEIFNNYFRPWLNISKDCGTGISDDRSRQCFYAAHGAWTDLGGNTFTTENKHAKAGNFYKVVLKNGMSLGVAKAPESQRIFIAVDVTGKGSKSIVGKDVFFFTLILDLTSWGGNQRAVGLYPGLIQNYLRNNLNNQYYNSLDWVLSYDCTKNTMAFGGNGLSRDELQSMINEGTVEGCEGKTMDGCFGRLAYGESVTQNRNLRSIQGGLCAQAIIMNGWKIPDRYPW